MSDFYKYVYCEGSSYRVMKDNVVYGVYKTVTDALYERDRLIEADWDWDVAMELPETRNEYLYMVLPEFNHNPKYISHKKEYWKVYKGRQYVKGYKKRIDAEQHAERIKGRVVRIKPKWIVQKWIDGQSHHFGNFDSEEEAIKRRDELIKCGWRR